MFYCITYWTNLNKHQCSCHGACCADILNEDKYECKDQATRSAKKMMKEAEEMDLYDEPFNTKEK